MPGWSGKGNDLTTIAYNDGIMAADKLAVSGNGKHGRVTKIFKVNGHLVGIAGAMDVAIALLRWFENGCDDDDWPSL